MSFPFKVAWVFLFLLISSVASAQEPLHLKIDATLAKGGKHLDGKVTIEIVNNTGRQLDAIPIWLYPNRFNEPSPGLTDRVIHWIYPAGKSFGGMEVSEAVWNGELLSTDAIIRKRLPLPGTPRFSKDILASIRLLKPLEPGQTGTLELKFAVQIPKRRGRFGRWKGAVSLAGGWFPRPLSDLTGRNSQLPMDLINVDVKLEVPKKFGVVLHDKIFKAKNNQTKSSTIEVSGIKTQALVLVAMKPMEVQRQQFPWGEAVHVGLSLPHRKPTWKETTKDTKGLPNGLPKIGGFDRVGRALQVVDNTARLIKKTAPDASLAGRVVMVEIPAWDRLVQLGPGPVLVSDRTYKMLPFEKALWFHDLALARIVAAALVWPRLESNEESWQRFVVSDVIGSFIAGLYTEEIHGTAKSMKDLVGFASFIPLVDNLLYAPQIPFREVYSRSIEEPDFLRDEPWRFMNELPRGRRILAKIEDLIGDKKTQLLIQSLFNKKYLGFKNALKNFLGEDCDWFFEQWYGAYPKVNYHLQKTEDITLEDGTILHRAVIIREGRVISEPVSVRFIDKKENFQTIIWEGVGREGTVQWVSNAPLDKVEIDPQRRLVESSELTSDSALADNTNKLSWRPPLLSYFLISGDVLKGNPYISIGFSMRRLHDVSNSFHLGGAYTPRGYGGALTYYRHFGPKRTLNARRWYTGPTIAVNRVNETLETIGSLPEELLYGATMGSLSYSLGRNDRAYSWDPRSGTAFNVFVKYSAGRADDGRLIQVAKASGRVFGLTSIGIRHTFAAYAGVTGLVGQPAATNLTTLSERQLLRGFDVDETYGRVGMYTVAEYRHTLFDASFISTPIYNWIDRFQGVLFVGAGTVTNPENYNGMFTKDRIFTEIGYGLRIHMLIFGLQQYLVGLDFAVPITPLTRTIQYEQTDGTAANAYRVPYKIIFGITQTY